MLEGAETISSLVTQYPVIEQTYARMDSDLSAALRKSLLSFYIVILHFQIRTLQYFDASTGGKVLRAFKGMNPVTADNIRQQREAIDKHREKVDRDIGLVHADVTQHSLEKLLEGNDTLQTGQMELLTATRDGILALARNTGSAFRSEEAHIDRRFAEMAEMWSEPLDFWTVKLEEERIDREKEELRDIRRWLSVAEPETNYYDARGKRPMQLGDWLLEHRKFKEWEDSESSSLLWLYGFAGTGKTGLVCRVIQYLRDSLRNLEESRVAFFYCSNDKANTSRNENFSRSDPQEALRSIVSQLATSQQTRRAASILQEYYDTFGPHSDKHRILDYSDCVEILAAISKDNLTVIVLDAFDECSRDTSPKLIQRLKEVVRRSPKKVKIFISTRPFPAIENELTPEQSIEVTAKNNGEDVRAFIKQTLETRINEKALLNGNVPRDLKADIEGTLTNRARNMFLYASLLINQLCDRNRTDDEYSIRRKLDELPKNLTDVYSRTMAEIHDDKNNSQRSCRIAQDTFKWLLCGQERLPCGIFLEAVSPPERRTDIDEVLHACRTLIIREKDVFEFAHYSVREHISRMEEYSRSKCHVVATQSCLRILGISFETEKHHGLTESQQQFNQYALLYWPLHYESVGDNEMNEHRVAINAMLRTFLLQGRSKTDKYATWLTEAQEAVKRSKDDRYLSSKLDHLRANPPTALFAACVFGLDDIIGKFGRELDGLNKSNTYGQTALCLAIENKKLEVVKALLSRRFPADLNLLNVKAVQQFEDYDFNKPQPMILYASALQCAAATGALKIADYLIEKGAHVDMVAGYYGSPLQAAALRGHSDIVSLLLRKGAEPNSQGGYHGTYFLW